MNDRFVQFSHAYMKWFGSAATIAPVVTAGSRRCARLVRQLFLGLGMVVKCAKVTRTHHAKHAAA